MQTLSERIRRARKIRGISQQALADAVGVQRSAVAQWERPHGSYPSMNHMIATSLATGVRLEWLGTGRGAERSDETVPALNRDEYAQDELEAQCLVSLRRLPWKVRESVVHMLSLVSNNFK